MAYRIRIPFSVFSLEMTPGRTFLTPLSDSDTMRYGQHVTQLAKEFEQSFQKVLLDSGTLDLLRTYQAAEFDQQTITVTIPEAKDGIRHPALTIHFNIYVQEQADGYWGVLPVLGVEGFAKTTQKLRDHLVDTVKVDFARHRRGRHVKQLIEVFWYEATRLHTKTLQLDVPDPGEEEANPDRDNPLLPQLASKLVPGDPATFGRKKSLDQVKRILSSSFNRNLLLVGNSGVGKSALVEELVRRLDDWGLDLEIWATTASAMMKALVGEQSWEFNIGKLVQELKGTNRVLYVRNLMDLFEVGKYEGNDVSMGAFLQPFLNRGELRLITECTDQQFTTIELKNPNYIASFQQIRLEEPPEAELFQMIEKKVAQEARRLGIVIEKPAIHEAVRLSKRFTPYAGMPGRPIRFLESILLARAGGNQQQLSRLDVIRYFCRESGMPTFMVDPSVPMEPLQVKRDFNDQIFSQEEAVSSVVDAMAAVKTALTRTGKPIASFLFVGPTGVGKTELAKVLAQFLFGQRNRMLRFDMSEFSTPAAVLRLTGLDAREDGLLTSAVRRQPFSVLLFDEIEKADESFYDLLLQLLSEGRLTDSRGRLANFCSTLIIMTSNIGAGMGQVTPIRLAEGNDTQHLETAHYQKAVQKHFRPELYNRIDKVIPFQSLDADTVRFVVDREIRQLFNREGIRFRNVHIELEDGVMEQLARRGYNPAYGARHLQRALREELVLPLSEILNQYEGDDQLQLSVRDDGQAIRMETTADPLAIELLLEELDKQKSADFASHLRRQMQQFQAGYYFTLLQQELDQLEEKMNKVGSEFWEIKQDVDRYWRLVSLRDRTQQLSEDIRRIEQQLSLMVLDQEKYRPDLKDAMDQWTDAYFELRLDVYVSLETNQNKCFFQIYGEHCEHAVHFYLDLFQQRELVYSLTGLYLRDSQFQQYQQDTQRPAEERQHIMPFLRKTIDYRKPDLSPEHEDDRLVGVECVVTGRGVQQFLKPEEGGQSWRLDPEEKERKCLVRVLASYEDAPLDIGRRDFVRKPEIRRTITSQKLQDSNFRINREIDPDRILPMIQGELENRFRAFINQEVQ
jgi:ATP-dependent Clp protease ATP-binding subunit ClpA